MKLSAEREEGGGDGLRSVEQVSIRDLGEPERGFWNNIKG